VASFHFDQERALWKLHEELSSKTYRPGTYRSFFIYQPKKRQISAEGGLAASDPADLLELRLPHPLGQLRLSVERDVQPQAVFHPHLRKMPEAFRGPLGWRRGEVDGGELGCGRVARLRHGLGQDEAVGAAEERIVSERNRHWRRSRLLGG
jgi:hypothetical protein